MDRHVAVTVESEDDSVHGKDADFDEEVLDNISSNRSGEHIQKIGFNNEELRRGAEVEVEATSHEATGGRGVPVRLGDPESNGSNTMGHRPNDRAIVVLQTSGLKAHTWAVDEGGGAGTPTRRL